MKFDGSLMVDSPAEAGPAARRLEEIGYDGAFTFEGPHDPFFPLVCAASETERLELATAVAIAFARSPMILANIGYDLQLHCKGRFTLGLGSQIRPHIERRFGQPWSKPCARMREMVGAIRAIWACWQDGTKLDFRGEFYTHTLMTPIFSPGPNPYGLPKIFLAGVGPKMTAVAGEVADGWFVHPLHTVEYLEKDALPALDRGLATAGRTRADIEISLQAIVVAGRTEEEAATAKQAAKTQIAFYGSTPAYRPVLDRLGCGELQEELNRLSKLGAWDDMASCIDDDLLGKIAVVGPMSEIAGKLRERYGAIAQRVSPVAPFAPDPERFAEVIKG